MTNDLALAWDVRVATLSARLPQRMRMGIEWLRLTSRRWLRTPCAVLLIIGGVFSILPILGLWMLPLGLALLAEDVPGIKSQLERAAC
ncbi:hypothetical protein D9599_19180 [Roseomonas sp. KE2513]|uniref:hypothetical protein n=1 Tax=Roseomonas sp. KE2513 TaxID=2479202 RepID=UPI0018DF20A1|nr:hypothetical protein [Roseomonas sp. KE2513]MBI0537687.1 hypothetical protein [Roseomonas sp. KE2513]